MKKFFAIVIVAIVVWLVVKHWDSIRKLFDAPCPNKSADEADQEQQMRVETVIGKTLVKLQSLGLIDTI